MKKLNRINVFFAVALLWILSACYELDLYPKSQLSPETFWKTDEHAKQGVMACYQALKWNETYYRFFGMDCLTDIGTGYDDAGYWDISRGTWTAASGYVLNRWTHSYDGISRTNLVIQNILSSETINEDVKHKVLGEAKFLRALYYFFLLNHFGGVPIYDETVDYNKEYMKFTKARSSEQDTRDFILKDLEYAMEALPVSWPEADYGRATKGAAYALRGRVYLYNQQYDLAVKDFEEIVLDPSGVGYNYELYPDYAGLFLPTGDKSNEMIFSVQNHASVGFNLGMPYAWYMGSNACVGTSWNNVMPSVDLVDSYELKDGRPFNWNDFIPSFNESREVREQTFLSTLTGDKKSVESYPLYYDKLLSMYEERDPRMQQTVILPYTHYKGWVGNKEKDCEYVIASGVATTNGFIVVNRGYKTYLFRKFVPEGIMGGLMTASQRASVPINFPIIRYADVLLMLAECYNEQGDIDQAVEYINKVRQRSSVNMPAINSGPAWLDARSKSAVFERIKHERAVEFPAEGLRYYDLKRWRLLKETQNSDEKDMLGTTIYVNKFEDKDYLWPIPLQERDRNKNLEQNQGW
ncbi:RagB/SusD family nutrient uptake outer membrane protein [Parabacteroides pacaensis]|uniref:RagB/SusD family nutrient uptake outer membrane protein n=1 Tax=Parabacteroides pacaensis TaxID=2086575 RepID=UPI000D0E5D90|nr:RagB/SusD family nutrient uptake outer membrane protein [Parabacteroides pacaensis]